MTSHHNLRPRERGESMFEFVASSFVVGISLVGMAGTVVYQRNLEDQTVRLWEATGEATAAIEELRADSRDGWSTLQDSWDGKLVEASSTRYTSTTTNADGTDEESETTKRSFAVSVSDDTTNMEDADGMWADGATTPGFYHVDIGMASADNEFANALHFQTYVANRSASTTVDDDDDDSGADADVSVDVDVPTSFDDDAERVNPSSVSVSVSGALEDQLTVTFENWSDDTLDVKKLKVEFKDDSELTAFSLDDTEFYNGDSKDKKEVDAPDAFTGIEPGEFTVSVTANSLLDVVPLYGQEIKLKITFEDGSKFEVTVEP